MFPPLVAGLALGIFPRKNFIVRVSGGVCIEGDPVLIGCGVLIWWLAGCSIYTVR